MPTETVQRNAALLTALRGVALFAGVEDALLQSIADRTRRRRYEAGFGLIARGDEGDKMFIILSGDVHIQRPTTGGRMIYLGLRGPGEIIGEMSLIDGQPHMADAVTASPCELLIVSRDAFLECIQGAPGNSLSVMGCLAKRLREAGDRQEVRHELDLTGRVAECLLAIAAAEGTQRQDGTILLAKVRTHQELAEMVGAARESVSRSLSDLRTLKLISAPARRPIIILNEARLRRRCAV